MDGFNNASSNLLTSLAVPLKHDDCAKEIQQVSTDASDLPSSSLFRQGSLQQLRDSDLTALVPEVSVSSHLDEPPTPNMDDLLSQTSTFPSFSFLSDLLKPSGSPKQGKPPLEHTSSLDSLVSILQALPGAEESETAPARSQSEFVKDSDGRRIWSVKPPINRAHSGFNFKPLASIAAMSVPGIPEEELSRVPQKPVLVKVDEKFASVAQASFNAALKSKWVDNGPDPDDSDDAGPRPPPIKLIAKTKPIAKHVSKPLPNSKDAIIQRVKELQAKLLGPYTRLGPKTPILPSINALDALFKVDSTIGGLSTRSLPQSMFNPITTESGATPSSKKSTLIKRRKTGAEDDELLDFDSLDRLMDDHASFGTLFGNLTDDTPSSETILGLNSEYDDLLPSFEGITD